MKKLTKEEAAKTGIIKTGRTSSVTIHLMELEIGEALIIERQFVKKPPLCQNKEIKSTLVKTCKKK